MKGHPVTTYNYVKNFTCLADKCENTCCQGWRIAVSDETANSYREFHPELYAILATDGAGFKIAGTEQGEPCRMLRDGLCGLQIDYGEETLADICVQYPRMYRSINDLTLGAATVSCPEVARLCLFGDNPFEPVDIELPKRPDAALTEIPCDRERIVALIQPFIAAALDKSVIAEQAVLNIIAATGALEKLEYHAWPEALETVFDGPGFAVRRAGKIAATEGPACHDIILILNEMLATPLVPKAVRERLHRVIVTLDRGDNGSPRLGLRDFYSEAYNGYGDICNGRAFAGINAVLKRYLAAEITRTGFPVLSPTVFGQDYGTSISAWAQTLAIRFLAMRLLLVSHIQSDGSPPRDDTIVDLVHRLSRKINHDLSGPIEKSFCEKTRDNFLEIAAELMVLS